MLKFYLLKNLLPLSYVLFENEIYSSGFVVKICHIILLVIVFRYL